jgi:hypothetical protein
LERYPSEFVRTVAKQKLFIFRDNIINKKDTIITIFVNNKKITISLEMPVPSQGHYGFHSFPVVD